MLESPLQRVRSPKLSQLTIDSGLLWSNTVASSKGHVHIITGAMSAECRRRVGVAFAIEVLGLTACSRV